MDREDSRISTAFVASMNTFLLAHGLDVCSKAAELHAAVHPFLMRALRSARDARLREALVLYLRIQLLLKGLEASGEGQFLEEVQDLLTHSAQQSGFTWYGSHSCFTASSCSCMHACSTPHAVSMQPSADLKLLQSAAPALLGDDGCTHTS